jgi:hypothetical protein
MAEPSIKSTPLQAEPDMEGVDTLTINELTAWVFGSASGADLIDNGAGLSTQRAAAIDRLLPKQPVFLFEMY